MLTPGEWVVTFCVEQRTLLSYLQNNGVIALTGVSSRQAGWACALILFIFGLVGKVVRWSFVLLLSHPQACTKAACPQKYLTIDEKTLA